MDESDCVVHEPNHMFYETEKIQVSFVLLGVVKVLSNVDFFDENYFIFLNEIWLVNSKKEL